MTGQSAAMSMTPVPIAGDVHVDARSPKDAVVTALSDGGFVVAWMSGQDGGTQDIYGQLYTPDGTKDGGAFRVNTETSDNQIFPSVTGLLDGGLVVTWTSLNQDGSGFGIYGQRFATDGAPVGAEFRVNTYTENYQVNSSVTSLWDGGFVVTWTSVGQDGSYSGVYGQRYAADGTAVGGEFRVSSQGGADQGLSSVTSRSDGGFVVTWASLYQRDPVDQRIYGQRYGADGVPVGDEFQVNSHTAGYHRYSSVTSLSDGGFVVTWTSEPPPGTSQGQDGSGSGVFGQRFAADGTAVGGEFQVNTYTTGDQRYSSVTSLPDGGFVVTWESTNQTHTASAIYGRHYAADGTPVGSEFRLNQNDHNPYSILGSESVTTLVDNHVVQVWSGTDVFFRLISVPGLNSLPSITSDGGHALASLSVAENATPLIPLTTVVAKDPDAGQTLTYSLSGGADKAAFTIDASTGALAFISLHDFEAPADADKNNVYEVVVKASDGAGGSASQAISVTVTDQNDVAPTITTKADLSVSENTQIVTQLSSADQDTVGTNPAEFSISGGQDAALFDVVGGRLEFKTAPDYETDPHTYHVQVTASDGVNHSDKLLTVTLTDAMGVTITGTEGANRINKTSTAPGQPLPTPEDDKIYGLGGIDQLYGLDGNDVLDGGPGNDSLFGGPGNDVLDGGPGSDIMRGEPGNDTYVVDEMADSVIEKPGEGIDEVQAWTTYTLPANVERLTLMGHDAINGTGNDLANQFTGNDAANRLDGGAGQDTLVGNAGDDTLDGGPGADVLLGGTGNDLYKVDDTFDLVDEGGAFPAYAGSAGDVDTIVSTASWFWDVYSVGEKMQIAEGAVGSDGAGSTIIGSIFANEMIGNSGTNIMFGRGGGDTYRAGDGVDWISLSLLGLTEKNAYAGVDAPNTIIVDPRHSGAFSYDIIFEFEAGKDKVDVSGYHYATAAEVLKQGHNDGLGNSYYALGDGYD